MFRIGRVCLDHPMGLQHNLRYKQPQSGKVSFLRRRVNKFISRGAAGRAVTLVAYGFGALAAYIGACLVVYTLHQPTVNALFHPLEDYTVEKWRDVEPTLRPGDILLMRGDGPLSNAITFAQYVFSWMHPAAMRYSHVAMVLEAAVEEKPCAMRADERRRQFGGEGASSTNNSGWRQFFGYSGNSSSSNKHVEEVLHAEGARIDRGPRITRGAMILEGMDNTECNIADVDGVVRHFQVMVVEATQRLCSVDPATQRPAYHHFAVRRLRGEEDSNHAEADAGNSPSSSVGLSPEQCAAMQEFAKRNVGRPLDRSVFYTLSFLSPKLYEWLRPERTALKEVSCSELLVELLQEIGMVERRWRWVPLSAEDAEAAKTRSLNNSNKSDGGSEEGAPSLPTAADRGVELNVPRSLHVYENYYAPVDKASLRPWYTRALPHVPVDAVIENASALTAAQPSPPLLRAGDLAQCGRSLCQLQWYYRHMSLQTAPHHFTHGPCERSFDWKHGWGYGDEIKMEIPNQVCTDSYTSDVVELMS